MIETLQRLAARLAAGVAIALGAVIALAIAFFVAISAIALGIVAAIAGWLGLRSLRRRQVPGADVARDARETVTVIDVDMREIVPGDEATDRGTAAARSPGRETK
jgi:hypothetical protein